VAIAYRSGTTAGNASGQNLVINKPSGVVDNDILILVVYQEIGASAVTPPAGFAPIGSAQANSGTAVMWVTAYWKRASGEGASYTITLSGSTWRVAALGAFSGCLTSDSPIDANTSYAYTTTTVQAAAITTSIDNAMVVVMMGNYTGADITAGTSGMTLAANAGLGGCEIFYALQASAGSTGTKSFSSDPGSKGATFTFDLKPDIGGGATPVSASDTGTGTDSASSLAVAHSRSDTGAATDGTSLLVSVSVSDTGTGTDSASPAAVGAVSGTDSGTGSDSAGLAVALSASDAGTAAESASAVPLVAGHQIAVANGYADVTGRQFARDSAGRLWVVTWDQFDYYPQGTTTGLGQHLVVWQADQAGTPATFSRMDQAHEPANVDSWAVAMGAGDVLHVVWSERQSWTGSQPGSLVNVIKYAPFDTRAGTWGTVETIESAASFYGFGQGDDHVGLAIDASGVPHVVYLRSDGTRRRVAYKNRSGGSWSSVVTVDDQSFGTNQQCWHPGIALDNAGRLVVVWARGFFDGNTDTTIFVRVNAGAWGTTHQVAGTNWWTGIDQGCALYIDTANRYHMAMLDPSKYIRYRFSDDLGVTWQANNPGYGTALGDDPAVGPGADGNVRIYAHGQAATNITYWEAAGGAAAWGSRQNYIVDSGYDCSVNVRWAQYFWHWPGSLDVLYWKSDYPTNLLYLGTDVVAADASPTASDAATGGETSSLAVSLTDTDSGVGSDTSSLGQPSTAVDAGTGTDASSLAVAHSRSDTGTATDAGSLAAAAAGSDTGTESETSGLAQVGSVTDAGTPAETSSLSVQLTASDAGTGADSASLAAAGAITTSDAGSGNDSTALVVSLTANDTAAGTDTAGLSASGSVSASDTGTLSGESASLAVAIDTSDAGSGLDLGTTGTPIGAADAGTAAETAALSVQLASGDAGTGLDSWGLLAILVAIDLAAGSERYVLVGPIVERTYGTAVGPAHVGTAVGPAHAGKVVST
jgi:hypothetical protein